MIEKEEVRRGVRASHELGKPESGIRRSRIAHSDRRLSGTAPGECVLPQHLGRTRTQMGKRRMVSAIGNPTQNM